MIQAITFDLDGVYFPTGKANFVHALEARGVPESEIKRVFMDSDEMNRRYKLGTMSDDEFWIWAAREWKLALSPQELIDLMIGSYGVDPAVEATVKAAQAHGYKTLVCSSNFPARVNGLQERFHFLDNFDAAVFSYEVGAPKPSPKLFAELIKRAAVPAKAIVFADDRKQNVIGARAAGITAFVYEGFDAFMDQLKALGVKL